MVCLVVLAEEEISSIRVCWEVLEEPRRDYYLELVVSATNPAADQVGAHILSQMG